jgi:hypothetical protein
MATGDFDGRVCTWFVFLPSTLHSWQESEFCCLAFFGSFEACSLPFMEKKKKKEIADSSLHCFGRKGIWSVWTHPCM